MRVRLLRNQDLIAVADILNREIRDAVAHFGTEPYTMSDLREEWARDREHYPWLVAEASDATIAGVAWSGAWNSRGAYRWSAKLVVYIAPGHQRRGVGRALYSALVPCLRAQGYQRALAGIALPNAGSVRLHEAFGLVHVGTLPAVGWKHGRWIDVGIWSVELNAADPPPARLRRVAEAMESCASSRA